MDESSVLFSLSLCLGRVGNDWKVAKKYKVEILVMMSFIIWAKKNLEQLGMTKEDKTKDDDMKETSD